MADLPDSNSFEQDRRQVRQQVADALGVSPAQVALEFAGEALKARVEGLPDEIELDWADRHDFERIKASADGACLVDFGMGDGPITIPRLIAASEGLAGRSEASVLVPRFRANLARQLGVPIGQVELRAQGGDLQARAGTGSEWRTLDFALASERSRLIDLAGLRSRQAAPVMIAEAKSGGQALATDAPGVKSGAAPMSLTDFGRGGKDQHVALPSFKGLADTEMVALVRAQVAAALAVPEHDVLLMPANGQLMATVIASGFAESVLSGLAEPFRGVAVTEVKAASPQDMSRLLQTLDKSPTPMLHLLGREGTGNPVLRIPHYPPDLGRDAEIARLRDDLVRQLGTDARNIEIFLNDDGIAQVKVRGSDKVRDLQFTTAEDFARFSRYIRENPGRGLDSFGQRRYDFVVDVHARTGAPDADVRTVFTQDLQSRVYLDKAGNHRVGFGAQLTETLGDSATQRFLLGYHHRQFGGLDLILKNDHGKLKISTGSLDSPFVTQLGQNTWEKLRKGDGKTIAAVSGVVVGVAGLVWAATELLPERQTLELPLDLDLFNNGRLKIKGGVRGDLTLGDGHLAYKWTGVRGAVEENIASGVKAAQRFTYDHEKQQLDTRLEATIHRFSANVFSQYNTSSGRFLTTTVSASQNFPLRPNMNMAVGANLAMNSDWKPQSTSGTVNVNYQMSNVWQLRAGVSGGWNRQDAAVRTDGPSLGRGGFVGAEIGIRARF